MTPQEDQYLTATVPTCDGWTERIHAGGWGIEQIACRQSVGLVSWRDYSHITRRACVRHKASVMRAFGVLETEPDWVLR